MAERIPLCLLPTPLHRLDRLSEKLSADIWIKRDDLTGFALGGNKGRKLEHLAAEIVQSGSDTVVSCGASQSNFLRQLAACCAVLGVRCIGVCMDRPYQEPDRLTPGVIAFGGNQALDTWFGLERQIVPDGTWDDLEAAATAVAEVERANGGSVYQIPLGGSGPLGVLAFYEAAHELPAGFDAVVTASSSGSTQVGLATAFQGTMTKVIGIACDPEPEIVADLVALSASFHQATGIGVPLTAGEIDFRLGHVGPGYGAPSVEGNDAIAMLARAEGILLDPVYSAKAFAGLIDLVGRGELTGRVCFWHTGGTPALFASAQRPI